MANQKSKVVAGILAILLGSIGIHNFYANRIKTGIAQLLITLLTFGVAGWAVWIWAVIEGVMMMTGAIKVDGRGVPFKT